MRAARQWIIQDGKPRPMAMHKYVKTTIECDKIILSFLPRALMRRLAFTYIWECKLVRVRTPW